MNKLTPRLPKYSPRDHQVRAHQFIKSLNSWALFMEQGTGKSKVTMMKAHQLGSEGLIDRLVVICPGAVKKQWAGEVLEEHSHFEYESLVYNGFSAKKDKYAFKHLLATKKFGVLVIHYEAFQSTSVYMYLQMFLSSGQALIVLDESTGIKNPNAARTRTIIAGFSKRVYKGILTGTPTPNSPLDLYSQFEFLKTNFWRMPYSTFERMYCILVKKVNPGTGRPFRTALDEDTWWLVKAKLAAIKRETGTLTIGDFDTVSTQHMMSMRDCMIVHKQEKYSPYKNLEELWEKIGPYTFTVKKEECMDLPPKVHEKLEVELSPEQKKAMRELKRHLITDYGGCVLTASNTVSCMCRIQCITGGLFPYQVYETLEDGEFDLSTHYARMKDNPKLRALLSDLDTVSNDTSVIVWAVFTEELLWIHEALKKAGHSCELYHGATSPTERDRIEEEFKEGKFRILVINPAVGEMGLNFQIATLHYFYSNTYMANRRLQAEDRSHRMGQMNKVTYKDLVCIGTLDERILSAIRRKEDLINYFRSKPVEALFD